MSQQLASVLAADTASQSRDSAGLLRVRPPAVLMELVERFRVCWETFPEVICIDRETRQVGFALELYGTHEPEDVDHHTQRCYHCQRVFAALHVIADWILPRERKASMYEAEVSSPSTSHSPARQIYLGPTFTIRIVHREGDERAAHDSETQWLKELEECLKELGAVKTETQASEPLRGDRHEREK
jgi:hypothetical protein